MRDYAEIEALIQEARQLRSQAVGQYLTDGWNWIARQANRLLARTKAPSRSDSGRPPYLPA